LDKSVYKNISLVLLHCNVTPTVSVADDAPFNNQKEWQDT